MCTTHSFSRKTHVENFLDAPVQRIQLACFILEGQSCCPTAKGTSCLTKNTPITAEASHSGKIFGKKFAQRLKSTHCANVDLSKHVKVHRQNPILTKRQYVSDAAGCFSKTVLCPAVARNPFRSQQKIELMYLSVCRNSRAVAGRPSGFLPSDSSRQVPAN